jgi:DNA-binding FrmR family transcriptional regulator
MTRLRIDKVTADKTYLAVPALTAFTLVRAKIKEGREYTNQLTGQSIQRVETGGKRVDTTLTMYQPVVRDGQVVRYIDLGDDSFSYPETAPSAQAEAGGTPITTMDQILDASVIQSLRDVLVEVMTGSIPDFAEQPPEMSAVGVPRYFHIDRIQFAGREDRSKEANLRVLLGVYEDRECTILKKYIQQDFVSAAVIAEKQKHKTDWQSRLTAVSAEMAAAGTTDERKAMLTAELDQLNAQLASVTAELDDLQPLAAVLQKPAIKAAIKEITESVLTDAVKNRPQYAAIVVEALMSRFDAAWASFVASVART